MSQHDGVIANGGGDVVRGDINDALAAARSGNSGATSPASPVAGMVWERELSATCLEHWKYDGAAFRIQGVTNPTSGKHYAANDRAVRGLTLSNNGTDATNDIDIAIGNACADADGFPMVLTSALIKRLDAAWAVGTNQGGLDTGSIANTTYHVWLIRRSDTGVVDVLFSTSASSPTMPADYDQKRRIGSILRESAAIVAFFQDGDNFWRNPPIRDVNQGTPGTSATTATLKVPTGISVIAKLSVGLSDLTPSTNNSLLVSSLLAADQAPSASVFTVAILGGSGAVTASGYAEVKTNTSGQIRYRSEASSADHTVYIITNGWADRRGQDAA